MYRTSGSKWDLGCSKSSFALASGLILVRVVSNYRKSSNVSFLIFPWIVFEHISSFLVDVRFFPSGSVEWLFKYQFTMQWLCYEGKMRTYFRAQDLLVCSSPSSALWHRQSCMSCVAWRSIAFLPLLFFRVWYDWVMSWRSAVSWIFLQSVRVSNALEEE